MPVSQTLKRSSETPSSAALSRTVTVISPLFSVNLWALESKLIRTCFKRSSSPTKFLCVKQHLNCNLIFLSSAITRKILLSCRSRLSIEKGLLSIWILPLSIFDISRISLTIDNKNLAEESILEIFFCVTGSPSPESRIRLANPMIAFKGVLISCDILERNSERTLLMFSTFFILK